MPRRETLTTVALGVACGPILCCFLVFAKCCCPDRLRQHSEPEDKRRFEKRQATAPRPLPVRPPERALTIRVPPQAREQAEKQEKLRKATRDQSASRLMQLPLELREMIYRAAIGDRTMHMVLKKYKLGHVSCKTRNARACSIELNLDPGNIWSPYSEPAEDPTDGDILPFLLTCRQIYSEAINLLYTTNTFSFADLDCLRHFSATILPHRWSLVQSLDIKWVVSWPIYDPFAQALLISRPALYPPHDEATWEGTWRIISEMANLKSLKVSLMYFDGFRDAGGEARLLAPMCQVKLPKKKFEVRLSWAGEEVKDVPFQIIRPGDGEWPLEYPSW